MGSPEAYHNRRAIALVVACDTLKSLHAWSITFECMMSGTTKRDVECLPGMGVMSLCYKVHYKKALSRQ